MFLPAFRSRHLFRVALLILLSPLATQSAPPTTTVPEVGIRDRAPTLQAIVNAEVCVEAGEALKSQTIVIENGVIVAVGEDITIPDGAERIDLAGKKIYPALIDAYSEIKVDAVEDATSHWNPKAVPQREAIASWKRNASNDKSYREAGYALRLIAPDSGVLRGQSAVVTTGEQPVASSVVREQVAQHVRLTTRGNRRQFPTSPMGAVALARQTFYDAEWYRKAWRAHNRTGAARPESNDALQSLVDAIDKDQLFVFIAPDEQYVLRANTFAVEFQLNNVAVVGSGREYQRLDAVADCSYPMIVPVNFPKAPNVATVETSRDATLADLMHWRLAPENPSRLMKVGVDVSLTSHGLKKKSDFLSKLRVAVERGLNPNDALFACTLAPAKLLGIESSSGSIAKGKAAHLMVLDGGWLEERTKVVETWVDGQRFEHTSEPTDKLAGTWKLSIDTKDAIRETLYLVLEQEGSKLSGKAWSQPPKQDDEEEEAESDEDESKAEAESESESESESDKDEKSKPFVGLSNLESSFGRLTANFDAKLWNARGSVRLTATVLRSDDTNELVGQIRDETGNVISFQGTLEASVASDEEGEEEEDDAENKEGEGEDEETIKIDLVYPLGAFGVNTASPVSQTVVFENATLWTCADEGIVEASVLVQDGKIMAVGSNLAIPDDALRIDASGKHITPGIVDCHSHMATDGGINEGTQAITSEVRIGDFIDATDIAIYRQLAGGVTTANVLHGSANPIGGQNQVIKLRWGMLPEQMKFAEAPSGIKFALGENVKQSNWGEEFRTRYPQSRLGVEQIMRDAFLAAKEYERQWTEWRRTGKGVPPRKDLELDAILEIVNHQRWIHCHSYRQDEIIALMRTLESFDIQIGTFQHILEGYKVAKEMAEHGAMGSSFADWWAYKLEVYDAIPYNGALMHQAGVVVSFNSDDRELARHLNHEAAKAVKYGRVPKEEALKFVTLNPAKQLRIDHWVGSIEVGKHADLVVWSGDPLQITSRCEQTWIEGVRHFDIEEDKERRVKDTELHRRLVGDVLKSGAAMHEPGERETLFRELFPRHDEYCGHAHSHGH